MTVTEFMCICIASFVIVITIDIAPEALHEITKFFKEILKHDEHK